MTDLTVALLTLARLDGGESPRVPGADVGVTTDAFAAAAARLLDEAQRRGVDVVIEPSPRLEVAVPSGLLMLLVGNLLQNAVKFSPAGGIVRAASAARDGEAVLSISDQGPGVPPEHAARIFDRFYRIDPARSAAVPGAGLGLSICRAIADRYRGALDVAPNPGGGSTFSVRLPLAPRESGEPLS
jgi:signal transduction histidine kinase